MSSRDGFQYIDYQKDFQNIESKNFLRQYPQIMIFVLVPPCAILLKAILYESGYTVAMCGHYLWW